MQLLAKFKKILYMGFRATLNIGNKNFPYLDNSCTNVVLVLVLEVEHLSSTAVSQEEIS